MPAMNDIQLDTLLAERREEHEKWNSAIVASSDGARERATTTYDIFEGPASPRRLRRLRKAGLKDKHLPARSIHIRLHPGCPRYNRLARKTHAA
jgi:hypothetical protein